jgi:hypothetical protein
VLWEKRQNRKKRNIKKTIRLKEKKLVAKNIKRAKDVKIAPSLSQL